MGLLGDDIDELLGREVIIVPDVLQALLNLVKFSQQPFCASVSRL